MLTAAQCRVVAFVNDYGELVTAEEAHQFLDEGTLGDVRPLTQYEADTWQSERYAGEALEDIWGDEADEHSDECVPALLSDQSGDEIVPAYHYHPEPDEDEDEPVTGSALEGLVPDA